MIFQRGNAQLNLEIISKTKFNEGHVLVRTEALVEKYLIFVSLNKELASAFIWPGLFLISFLCSYPS